MKTMGIVVVAALATGAVFSPAVAITATCPSDQFRRERPNNCAATEQGDEVAPFHSSLDRYEGKAYQRAAL
jgi:hypothetical protein